MRSDPPQVSERDHPTVIAEGANRKGAGRKARAWLPTRTQVFVLTIGLLVISNAAEWLALRDAASGPRITVVGVREMTQAYVRKISSPQLSEQESLLRAQMFVAAAQDELKRLVPSKRLVLAKECVLAGEQNDITAELQKAVETKLANDTVGLSNVVGPVQPGAAPLAAASGRVTAGSLLTLPPAGAVEPAR